MMIDVERRSEPIATGRTWRDIPPTPPDEAPAASPPLSVEPSRPDGHGSRRWWLAAVIGLLSLGIGVALGLWGPWQDASTTDEAAGETLPGPAVERPESSTTLPERIVPLPAEDPLMPDSLLPEEFLRFDGFPDLSELFGEGFGGRSIGPQSLDLIELRDLPGGYRIAGTALQSSPGLTAEELSLSGPAGPVTVRAERSRGAALPDGQLHEVGDISGVLVAGDPTSFAWLAEDDLLVTVVAPESGALDLVAMIVPGVEVVE